MAVLAIHDLSCYSKSSLTVVLPVLEALSVETAVLPTSLLSTQTDGFDDIFIRDTSEDMKAINERFISLGLSFDGIYSGYLGSLEEIDTVLSVIEHYDTLTLVDPVMGDDGSLYQTISREHARMMTKLVRKADIITPNLTEAGIIAELDLPERLSMKDIKELVSVLRSLGPQKGVITSIPVEGSLANAAWSCDEIRLFPFEDLKVSYPGTGDLFASLLFALIAKGDSFFGSVLHATSISSLALAWSKEKGRERRLGISLAPVMSEIRRRSL